MTTLAELREIKERVIGKIKLRQLGIEKEYIDEKEEHKEHHILVCGGTGCHSSDGDEIHDLLEKAVREKGLEEDVKVIFTGCFGLCESGPNVVVYPEGVFYSHVELSDIDEIVEELHKSILTIDTKDLINKGCSDLEEEIKNSPLFDF